MSTLRQITALFVACSLACITCPVQASAFQASPASDQPPRQSAEQLEQLVAPIALYPDALVAQILAGSTYPTQVVEADRWVKQNSSLKGEALAKAVDQQPWDVSIKALTQFPSVLDNMSTNLSWTSALGDAYFNEQQEVMATVQKLRRQAKNAGNLKTTKEQIVTTEGQTIIIQPASPQIVYVPSYNPTVIYGAPIAVYPGYRGWDVAAASMISFGVGVAVGAAMRGGGCCGWGWNSWGTNWRGGTVVYNRNVYVSNSNNFVNRNSYYRNNSPRPTPYGNNNINRSGNNLNRGGNLSGNMLNRGGGNTINRGGNTVNVNPGGNANRNQPSQLPANRGNDQNRSGATNRENIQRNQGNANHGFGQSGDRGTRSNAFSGYGSGGSTAAAQSRGRSSYSGGGGAARSGAAGGGGRPR